MIDIIIFRNPSEGELDSFVIDVQFVDPEYMKMIVLIPGAGILAFPKGDQASLNSTVIQNVPGL